MKPIIGITANYMTDGSAEYREGIGAPDQEWQLLADDYITSVKRAGGIPMILPVIKCDEGWETCRRLIDISDGILFSGGSDLDPKLFGDVTTGKTGNIISERDEQELYMFHYVLKNTKKPILGICRGIQLMNVALGGNLIQHIPDTGRNSHALFMYPRHESSHWVSVERDSLLYRIVDTEKLGVNSFHHMAVNQCAPDLKVVSLSDDGIVEAVELKNPTDARFFLGVQWHPEMMAEKAEVQQRIITTFVESC